MRPQTLDQIFERAGLENYLGSAVTGANESAFQDSGFSAALVDLLKVNEGFRAGIYNDGSGVLTQGFGNTDQSLFVDSGVSVERANEIMLSHLESFRDQVQGAITSAGLDFTPNQNQIDAMISLAYNGGIGALDSLFNKGRTESAIAENWLSHYTTASGIYMQGLANRRRLESALFTSEATAAAGDLFTAFPDFGDTGSTAAQTGQIVAEILTGTLTAQEYGASRGGGARSHAGQDLDLNAHDAFSSIIGGEVTRIGSDPGGYGNYVDIFNAGLNVVERVAELDYLDVNVGDVLSAGDQIGSGTLDTGVVHYEIRTDADAAGVGGFGFAGTVDPIAYLEDIGLAIRDGLNLTIYDGGRWFWRCLFRHR